MMPSPAWHRRWVRLGDLSEIAWQWLITALLAVLVITASVGLATGVLHLLLELAKELR